MWKKVSNVGLRTIDRGGDRCDQWVIDDYPPMGAHHVGTDDVTKLSHFFALGKPSRDTIPDQYRR